jgi:hypothetical protein
MCDSCTSLGVAQVPGVLHRGVVGRLVPLHRRRGVCQADTTQVGALEHVVTWEHVVTRAKIAAWVVKGPVRPYKTATQNRFTVENAKAT